MNGYPGISIAFKPLSNFCLVASDQWSVARKQAKKPQDVEQSAPKAAPGKVVLPVSEPLIAARKVLTPK